MKKIRLTQLDGKLPNLALMKLAHWHRARGDEVHLTRLPNPTLFEPAYDVVYASAIFEWTEPVVERLKAAYPDAIVGGTHNKKNLITVENIIGSQYENYDYSIYPDYPHSIGFTQRGCRLNCPFCIVPIKEGKPESVNTIRDIWREGTPRKIVLLDNDFFGQGPWRKRIAEIRDGGFRVSFDQGINIRLVNDEIAEALASVEYRDDDFHVRRLYCAWDNLGDERRFFTGMNTLNDAGIPPTQLMVYMLIGFRPGETIEDILYRFNQLKAAGCRPYPMVYERWKRPDLRLFARWAIRRYHEFIPWNDFRTDRIPKKQPENQLELISA